MYIFKIMRQKCIQYVVPAEEYFYLWKWWKFKNINQFWLEFPEILTSVDRREGRGLDFWPWKPVSHPVTHISFTVVVPVRQRDLFFSFRTSNQQENLTIETADIHDLRFFVHENQSDLVDPGIV